MTDTDTVIDDPMLDEEWLAAPVKRSRLRVALAVVLVVALCFLAGAMVQKHFGVGSAVESATGPGGFAGGQLPAGLPEGGFPGGAPGASEGAADNSAGADGAKSVIGKVVEVRGEVWIVEDLGGRRHRIKVGDDTDIVREARIDVSGVKVGDPVDVSGTTSNGRLQAIEVILR